MLFPPFAALAVIAVDDAEPSPYAEERAAVAGAVAARRRQFFAGRACAHMALRTLGLDGPALGRGNRREPLWPPGAVGSISHAGDLAASVTARRGEVWGLGIDLEMLDPPLDAAVERLVHTPGELALPPADHPLLPHRSKIAFSGKECVYKALFPATGWPLDFLDVAVEVDLDHRRYRAVVDGRFRLAGCPFPPLEGRFAVVAGYLVTGLSVDEPVRHPGVTG